MWGYDAIEIYVFKSNFIIMHNVYVFSFNMLNMYD
jgi:hypothetical protein